MCKKFNIHRKKMEWKMYIPCLAHRRFSVGKSVGRVAHRDSFPCILLFESICNDRSIIIRLQISLAEKMDEQKIRVFLSIYHRLFCAVTKSNCFFLSLCILSPP